MVLDHNDINGLPDHTIVYGYRCQIRSTVFTNRSVGKVIKHVVLTRGNWGKQVARLKQDGTPYAKESCTWTHNFFETKQEAENQRLESIQELKEGLQTQVDTLQAMIDSY